MFFFPLRKQIEFACAKCSDFAPFDFPIHKLFFKFTSQDLINYARENPEVCEGIISKSSDKRYAPSTFIIPTEKNYLVAQTLYKTPGEYVHAQLFNNIEEAVADYVLWNWKLPRLRSPQTEKRLRTKDFITFLDEDGNIFDKTKGRFKYYDETEKKFNYYD